VNKTIQPNQEVRLRQSRTIKCNQCQR